MLAHDRTGSGSPLLLLHGIAHRRQAFDPVVPLLAAHHEVIAVDLPGFGASGGPFPATIAATADALAAFTRDLGVERPHVAGNSLGGALALEMAARGQAASATALSPAGFITPAEGRRALLTLATMRASTYAPTPVLSAVLRSRYGRARAFRDLVVRPENLTLDRMVGDSLAMRRCTGFRAAARALRPYRFDGTVDVPVTVAWGEQDRLLRPHQADRARTRLPGSRHVPLPGCGHVPMSDDPDLVASVILDTTGRVTSPA